VAAALCKGGPIKYAVREGSGVSDDWISKYIVPRIASRFPWSVALVLGRALLWLVRDDTNHYLPEDLSNRVFLAYRDLPGRTLPLGINPIKKVLLIVTGDKGEVYIDELGEEEYNDGMNEHGSNNAGRRTRQ
jgi:hypothetical protein